MRGLYRHYRGFYLLVTIDRIVRSRSTAEALALRTDLRQAIEPLMAALGMEPDWECSECGGHDHCCAVCVIKWRKMEMRHIRKEKEVHAAAVKAAEGDMETMAPSLSHSAQANHQDEQGESRKRKKKLWKKEKRAMRR